MTTRSAPPGTLEVVVISAPMAVACSTPSTASSSDSADSGSRDRTSEPSASSENA